MYTIKYVHKDIIAVGDNIICPDGRDRTVCSKDIKRCNILGVTIFGDSYNAGHKLVPRLQIKIN